ncbi:hypothetical protein [Fluviicola taffensis]|uniref:Uncharacterized protein n=1 Tax=Fluviicola taffensis (strain DSM 16823 / NCIMB 13979 / RW262) TaxID=755732 RepID=F2IAV6_FLUTR|nr:hypothetical protein [Fluviicola taffensis]AEA45280.1 hypothetical protein Fluta_3308 [Fluviicola taffensis DSM 16823]
MNQENKYIIDDLEVTPIQIPSDSYFEDLKQNILNQIDNPYLEKKNEPRIITIYRRWYVWGSAAAVLLFALLFSWNTPNSVEQSNSVNLSSVSNEEIYEYLDKHIEDLDSEVIVSHIDNTSLIESTEKRESTNDVTQLNTSPKKTLFESVDDEEIMDYLKNESTELDEYLLIES